MDQAPKSISDVAKAAGVSMKTVSRVINNEPNVTDKTKSRVLDAIESLSYTPSVSARVLAGNKTYSIVLFCVVPRGDYIANIHFSALSICQARGYRLHISLIEDYYELEEELLHTRLANLMKRPHPDGVILIPPFCDNATITKYLTTQKIPFVRIAPTVSDPIIGPIVNFDEQKATDDLIQYLIDLGHRRIALVKGNPSHGGTLSRTKGYMQALSRNNIEIDPMLIFQGDFLFPSGLEAGNQLLSLSDRPTAVFASNDEMAAGVSMAVHKAGLDVPTHMSIVGFDDHLVAQSTWPPLTTIRQPLNEMATTAASWLIDATAIPEKKIATLDYVLVKRDSAAAIMQDGPKKAT